MTWYFYLNYRIYKFYERKRDSTPAFFSFSATMVLVSLNIFSIIGATGFFINPVHDLILKATKYSILILYAAIGLFNYLTLYKNKYYEEVFDDFDKQGENYKGWNLSVKLYIILSIVFLLGTLALADLRNHGRI
jgi:Ca2+/Na+ antiporter